MGKVVAIASGKGGTGKSTVTAFLARALSEQGKSTLVVEADFGLRGLDLILGNGQRLGNLTLLVHGDLLAKLLMDSLHDFHTALIV